jgi:hypothetical protein
MLVHLKHLDDYKYRTLESVEKPSFDEVTNEETQFQKDWCKGSHSVAKESLIIYIRSYE